MFDPEVLLVFILPPMSFAGLIRKQVYPDVKQAMGSEGA